MSSTLRVSKKLSERLGLSLVCVTNCIVYVKSVIKNKIRGIN